MNFDSRSKVPIYLQVAFTLRENILKRNLKPDEQMPSIRVLAKKMHVNPNKESVSNFRRTKLS